MDCRATGLCDKIKPIGAIDLKILGPILVRTCVDRLVEDGKRTVHAKMLESKVQGVHRLDVSDGKGGVVSVELAIKYEKIKILPPTANLSLLKNSLFPDRL